jgi:hypothetical protein
MTYGQMVEYRADEQFQARPSDVATERRRTVEYELCSTREAGERRWPDPLERLGGLLMQAGRLFGGGGGPMTPSPA